MIFLSDAERVQLRGQHKRERDKRICDFIKAVLLYDKDWSIASIAEALLLSEDAIREHLLNTENPVHEAQLLSYLKLSGCKVGLLINFNVKHLKEGIRRMKS